MSLSDWIVHLKNFEDEGVACIQTKHIKASIKKIKEKLKEVMEFAEIGCEDDWKDMCKEIDKEMGDDLK